MLTIPVARVPETKQKKKIKAILVSLQDSNNQKLSYFS
jgi:hypothetical protein